MTHEQLAELLAGIAKSQNAVLDAMDRAMPGFKNTHLPRCSASPPICALPIRDWSIYPRGYCCATRGAPLWTSGPS